MSLSSYDNWLPAAQEIDLMRRMLDSPLCTPERRERMQKRLDEAVEDYEKENHA